MYKPATYNNTNKQADPFKRKRGTFLFHLAHSSFAFIYTRFMFTRLLSSLPTRALLSAAIALSALSSACSYSHADTPAPCNDPTPVTYEAVISPIFEAHCRACHGSTVYSTLGGNNDYSDYTGIKKQSASLILSCINHEAGFDPMPKSGGKLSDCDIERIRKWIEAGQPNN